MIPQRASKEEVRHRYFPLPNEIFHGGITACEFAIMAYLYSRAARKIGPPTLMTVLKNLSVSRNTLKKYVRRLQKRDWIIVQHHRFSKTGLLSLRDTIHLTDAPRPRVGHFFPLPNSVFSFGLSVGEIAVYGYLLYREDRESFECWPSYRTIGAALCMSRNTVMKYVHRLEEKEFIVTEPTQVKCSDGSKRNGNLKHRVRPIQSVIKAWNARQARKAKQESMLLRAKQIAAHRPGFTVSESIPEGRR
jgi:DNA-binding MarR family transcriptional regulator